MYVDRCSQSSVANWPSQFIVLSTFSSLATCSMFLSVSLVSVLPLVTSLIFRLFICQRSYDFAVVHVFLDPDFLPFVAICKC